MENKIVEKKNYVSPELDAFEFEGVEPDIISGSGDWTLPY